MSLCSPAVETLGGGSLPVDVTVLPRKADPPKMARVVSFQAEEWQALSTR